MGRAAGFALITMLSLTAGCAITSGGLGVAPSPRGPVALSWQGSGERAGRMTAKFADGLAFEGDYSVTEDSDRAVADLANVYGEHMICRFRLLQPAAGMSGGGRGECRLVGGASVDAHFPGSQPGPTASFETVIPR